MKFEYQARTKEGTLKVGQVEASSYEAALEILQSYGYYVTYLAEVKKKSIFETELKFLRRITKRDILNFTRQLGMLLVAQIPPVDALHTLASQTDNLKFRDVILKLAREVEGGRSFSSALSLFPNIFSPFYINMIRAGEATGDLPKAFLDMADYLEKEEEVKNKIKSALYYPTFVISVMVLMIILMIYFVFPQLEKVFLEAGRELPPLTKVVFTIVNFLRVWLPYLVVGLALSVWILFYLKKNIPSSFIDSWVLSLPIIGALAKKVYVSRFAQSLHTLVEGGIPIAQALEISGRVAGNRIYQKAIFSARDGVRRGESISSVFKRYPDIIPPFVTQMIFVGERTGKLAESLEKVYSFYSKEVDVAIDRMISLFEPLLIIIIGLGVGIMLLTVLMPIYQLGFTG